MLFWCLHGLLCVLDKNIKILLIANYKFGVGDNFWISGTTA